MSRLNEAIFAIAVSMVGGALGLGLSAEAPAAGTAVSIQPDAIAGAVTSAHGPEAGVWVIAESDDFQTRFAKIVVTDDQGRYLIPALPEAKYRVWVRGYGLLDSPKLTAHRGSQINLSAVVAPDAASAAQVYPAAYWYAMLKLPQSKEVE